VLAHVEGVLGQVGDAAVGALAVLANEARVRQHVVLLDRRLVRGRRLLAHDRDAAAAEVAVGVRGWRQLRRGRRRGGKRRRGAAAGEEASAGPGAALEEELDDDAIF
jgi:hypothetical protein